MDENFQPPQTNNRFVTGVVSSFVFIWDFLKVILVALIIILPIRYFVFQPFIVSGSSMEPNYSNGQYLIIDEMSYYFRPPARGEIVVVHYPKDPKQFFIKRIIGLPNEKIRIDNGQATVFNDQYPQGISLDEPYLPNQGLTFPHNTQIVGGKKTLALGADEYFLMGDNRLASSDSRDWGVLKRERIVGKVFLRLLPLPDFDKFQLPAYSFQ